MFYICIHDMLFEVCSDVSMVCSSLWRSFAGGGLGDSVVLGLLVTRCSAQGQSEVKFQSSPWSLHSVSVDAKGSAHSLKAFGIL